MRPPVLLALALLAGCRAPGPGATRPPRPLVLDSRSFAFDAVFVGEEPGCALLEDGEYRLAIYDGGGGRRRQLRLGPGQDGLSQLAVQPGGHLLAAAFREVRQTTRGLVAGGRVVLYELPGGRALAAASLPSPALAVRFLDDERLVVGTEARYRRGLLGALEPVPESAGVCLLDRRGALLGCARGHRDSVTSLTSIPGGLASGSWDGTVRLWSPRLALLGVLDVGAPVNALAATPGAAEPTLVVATSAAPPRRSRELVTLERRGLHRRAAAAGDRVELWSLRRRARLRSLQPHTSSVTELAARPDASLIASGGWDWALALTRPAGSERLTRFSQIVTGLALSPRGDRLLVAAWSEHGSGAPSCLLLPLAP